MAPLPGGRNSETLACRYMSVLRYTTGAGCTRSFKWRGSLQGGLPALVRLLRRPAQQNFKVHASGRLLKPLVPAAQANSKFPRQAAASPGAQTRRRRPSSCRRSTVITPQHAPDRSHICPDFSITCSPSPARHPVRLTNLNSERHTDRRVASSPRVAPSPPRNIDAFCRCGRAQPAPARPVTHLLNIPRAPFAPIFQSPAAPPPPRGTLFQTAAVLT
jgi:hypothetical protein